MPHGQSFPAFARSKSDLGDPAEIANLYRQTVAEFPALNMVESVAGHFAAPSFR
jgi:short-subunit dehydrogenase involved in D-alanine esterification of teichoic acids